MKEQDIIQYFAEQEAQQKTAEEKKAKEATAKIRKKIRNHPSTDQEGAGTFNLDNADPMYMKLNAFFDIPDADQSDPSSQEKLKDIYLWTKQKLGTDSLTNIKLEIRKIQNKLGRATADYKKVYQFIRLSNEKDLLKEEMKLLKG